MAMKIIDFHTHPWRPDDLAAGTVDFIRGISPAVQEHGDALRNPAFAAKLLREQDVLRAVVLPEHSPATSGNVRTETVIELCRDAPDVLLPFANVNPNVDSEPARLLERYIADGPVHGLKLYPSYQFYYPNEARLYPIYEVCRHHGLPVLFHVGSSVLPGTRIEYCDPIHLDDLAVDFPDLTVVMAHGGRGFWYDRCAFLARHRENFHIDVAGLVPQRLPEHFPNLADLTDKLVFGSDWPAMPRSPLENARAIAGLGLRDDAVENVLWRNAARILDIDA